MVFIAEDVSLMSSVFLCFADNSAEDWEQPVCKRFSRKWRHGAAQDVQDAKVATEFSTHLEIDSVLVK